MSEQCGIAKFARDRLGIELLPWQVELTERMERDELTVMVGTRGIIEVFPNGEEQREARERSIE
ncbi:MAG: hypothetical protein WC829_03240 [Hyphomicrobium sp.]|jgi:hypothetical protein